MVCPDTACDRADALLAALPFDDEPGEQGRRRDHGASSVRPHPAGFRFSRSIVPPFDRDRRQCFLRGLDAPPSGGHRGAVRARRTPARRGDQRPDEARDPDQGRRPPPRWERRSGPGGTPGRPTAGDAPGARPTSGSNIEVITMLMRLKKTPTNRPTPAATGQPRRYLSRDAKIANGTTTPSTTSAQNTGARRPIRMRSTASWSGTARGRWSGSRRTAGTRRRR